MGQPQELPPFCRIYPYGIPEALKQGSFGEVIAGLLAETCGAAGYNDWEVPAHLFHTHITLFQQLEQQMQSGVAPKAIPGRTGDDCLAFRRDRATFEIKSVLLCESKCTTTHKSTLITEAHKKVSASGIVDIFQLVEALQNRNSPESNRWADSLLSFHNKLYLKNSQIHRCDAVYYVHGQCPKNKDTWIPSDKPPKKYKANRHLHSVEILLSNVTDRIQSIYSEEVWK